MVGYFVCKWWESPLVAAGHAGLVCIYRQEARNGGPFASSSARSRPSCRDERGSGLVVRTEYFADQLAQHTLAISESLAAEIGGAVGTADPAIV